MAVERYVISANIKKVKVKEFLSKELERAGIGSIEIQRTPMDTRVIIHAQRPGIVIGKKGTTIKSMTEILRNEYGLDNPQIEVNDLKIPELSAPVMAQSIASSLERGFHFRRAAYSALRNIMSAGAIGCQITLSGKLTGERSRMEKFVSGYIKHCGEPADRLVLKGFAEAAPKLGRIGVKVKILPPGAKMPDNITITPLKEEEIKPVDDIKKTKPSKPSKEDVKEETKGPVKDKTKKEKPVKDKTKKEKKSKKPKSPPKKEKSPKEKKEVNLLDKSAKDILKSVKDMEKKELTALLKKEEKNKNRKTVISGIKKLLSKE